MTTQDQSAEALAWHALDVSRIESELGTNIESGLNAADATLRLTEQGPNVLQAKEGPSRIRLFLNQFADALIWVLLVAAFISGVIRMPRSDTPRRAKRKKRWPL
jgi:Ca2+-transporting ATPase